ncbi:hypothetical protein CC78DRAFT_362370 [Lojkania enalia]|uniref:Uncharacterized protein n=1 Tax=Lojkania enalia TaxID=147567 RepID=A0A9P4K3D2_9PLEO|nr:hypothetical protein CC78DRAFT_362370 [Didymosphaeria enalia]
MLSAPQSRKGMADHLGERGTKKNTRQKKKSEIKWRIELAKSKRSSRHQNQNVLPENFRVQIDKSPSSHLTPSTIRS